jgi:hypothetical protein
MAGPRRFMAGLVRCVPGPRWSLPALVAQVAFGNYRSLRAP